MSSGNGSLRVNQLKFLAAFAKTGNVTLAARAADVHRISHYDWLRDSPAYVKAFADASEEAIDYLEAEARRRALHGVEEPVIHQGKLCTVVDPETGEVKPLTIRRYSDTLLIFLLKGARPEKYRERIDVRRQATGLDLDEMREAFAALASDPEAVAALEVLDGRLSQLTKPRGEVILDVGEDGEVIGDEGSLGSAHSEGAVSADGGVVPPSDSPSPDDD